MRFKNFIIITLIFVVPLIAYYLMSKPDATYASKASTANRPQIIKFTSAMCLDCKKLEGTLKEVYPKYSNKVVLVEVHVQDNTPFTKQQIEKYNVTLVPTMILLNSKGKKVAKYEGYIPKDKLDKILKDLANG